MSKKDNIFDFDDMGFSFGDDLTEENKVVKQSSEETQKRLDKLFSTINAFLDNMAKDPEKETLVWPNRAKKIGEFKEMLKKIKEGDM